MCTVHAHIQTLRPNANTLSNFVFTTTQSNKISLNALKKKGQKKHHNMVKCIENAK